MRVVQLRYLDVDIRNIEFARCKGGGCRGIRIVAGYLQGGYDGVGVVVALEVLAEEL